MSRIISFFNQKGGVAKTTTAINTAGILAKKGIKVLVIDLDAQASATLGLGLNPANVETTLDVVMLNSRDNNVEDLVYSINDFLHVIPSNISFSIAETKLSTSRRREDKLKNALEPVIDDYDFILIDCPPNYGLVAINALSASGEVVIPCATDYYSLAGLNLVLDSISDIQYEVNPKLDIAGILLTRFVSNTVQAREIAGLVRKQYEGKIRVFDSTIRETVKIKEAPATSETIIDYAPNHAVAQDYINFVEELL